MRKVKMWVDDVRLPPEGFDVWCLTAEHATKFLDKHWSRVEVLSLDHDLGDESYGTGYDVIKWMEEKVYVHSWEPTMDIHVHSDNGPGIKNIRAGIESIKRRA